MNTPNSDQSLLDVAVVGGSIAGCVTAIRFSQMGYRVGIFDKKTMGDQSYKQLCTHFIQPHAVPVLAQIGLAHLYEPAYSVPTKAVFVTPGGLVEGPGNYLPGQQDLFALNLERRILDPALRAAAQQQGVRYLDATTVESIEQDDSGWSLHTRGETGSHRFRARLVVAADGRRSRLARELGNPTEEHPNDRASLRGYFTGIKTREDDRSVFIMNDRDLACVYPLPGGRTQLVLFAEKSRVESWRGPDGRLPQFLTYFDDLPDAPSMSDAVPETTLLGYTDYPNQIRQPVWGSIPFVGDAALSLDPMSGVGCGFALVSADLLARSFADRSLTGDDLRAGLDEYRARFEAVLLPHAEGICRDALVDKDEAAQRRTFETISGNPELSQKYLALTGRMLLPDEFKQDLMRAMMSAAFLKRRPRSSPTKPS
ncbi:NAD(P)/FAD-dependent oxidoreductase [Micromonospora echinofusca]|uniref:NAD(P)/FAD-dependent oxidoreductase n=1 Tax=Micromonospora echinofusca TaxID=47858 RepID=UPI001AD7A7F6|nr:NAD(P)/FAD-dependent oxidoreductase [Micromonospora echinofusca]